MPQSVEVPDVGTVEFPDDATQEEIYAYLNKQYPAAPKEQKTSRLGALAIGAAESAIPSFAFSQGAQLGGRLGFGLGTPLGPIGQAVGAIGLGAGVGGVAAGLAQAAEEKIAKAVLPESMYNKMQEYREAAHKEHPEMAFGGELVGAVPSFRLAVAPSDWALKKIAQRAAFGAGFGAIQPMVAERRMPTTEDITKGAIFATSFSDPRLQLTKGPYARSVTTTTKEDGNLPAPPVQGQGALPLQEGQPGVQPPAQAVAKGAQVPLEPKIIPEVDSQGRKTGLYTVTFGLEKQTGLSSPGAARAVAANFRASYTPPATAAERPAEPMAEELSQAEIDRIAEREGITKKEAEDLAYHRQEREGMAMEAAKAEGQELTIAEPTPDQPFTAGGFLRALGGNRIALNRDVFHRWAEEHVTGDIGEAIRTAINEERVHNDVINTIGNAGAESYWNDLTGFERAVTRKTYAGQFGAEAGESPAMMGHESIRYRLQKAMGMEPSEYAQLAGLEKWGIKSINALSEMVRATRESLGTKASQRQLALLDRIQGNLVVAAAVNSGVAPPESRIREKKPTLDELADYIKAAQAHVDYAATRIPQNAQEKADARQNLIDRWIAYMDAHAEQYPKSRIRKKGEEPVRLSAYVDGQRHEILITRDSATGHWRATYFEPAQYETRAAAKGQMQPVGHQLYYTKEDAIASAKGEARETIQNVPDWMQGEEWQKRIGAPAFKETPWDELPFSRIRTDRKIAQDYDYYRDRLRGLNLLEHSQVVKLGPQRYLAVPVGGARKSGSIGCADFFNREGAEAIADQLRGRRGFPDVRVVPIPEREGPEFDIYRDGYTVEWGKPIDWVTGWDDPDMLEQYHERLGKQFGYKESGPQDYFLPMPDDPYPQKGLFGEEYPYSRIRKMSPEEWERLRKAEDEKRRLGRSGYSKGTEPESKYQPGLLLSRPGVEGEPGRVGATEAGAIPIKSLHKEAERIMSGALSPTLSGETPEGPAILPDFKELNEWAKRNVPTSGLSARLQAWKDAITKHLQDASPARLMGLIKGLGLEKEVGSAPFAEAGAGLSAKKGSLVQTGLFPGLGDQPSAESTYRVERRVAGDKTRQERRELAITEIYRELMRRAQPEPDLHPKEITLGDIDFANARAKHGSYRAISAEESTDPAILYTILSDGARESSETLLSHTKRLVALKDRNGESVRLVSVYPEREVLKVVDPAKFGTTDRPNVPMDEKFLARFQPIASVLRNSPVQDFHQRFKSLADWNTRIGKDAARIAGVGDAEALMQAKRDWREAWDEAHADEEGAVAEERDIPVGLRQEDIVAERQQAATQVKRGEGGGLTGEFTEEGRALMGIGRGELGSRAPLTASEVLAVRDLATDPSRFVVTSADEMFEMVGRAIDRIERVSKTKQGSYGLREPKPENLRAADFKALIAINKASQRLFDLADHPKANTLRKLIESKAPEEMLKVAKAAADAEEDQIANDAYSNAIKQLYEIIKGSKDEAQLVATAIGRFGRTTYEAPPTQEQILRRPKPSEALGAQREPTAELAYGRKPAGGLGYTLPPRAELPRFLSPEAAEAVRARAEAQFPYERTPFEESKAQTREEMIAPGGMPIIPGSKYDPQVTPLSYDIKSRSPAVRARMARELKERQGPLKPPAQAEMFPESRIRRPLGEGDDWADWVKSTLKPMSMGELVNFADNLESTIEREKHGLWTTEASKHYKEWMANWNRQLDEAKKEIESRGGSGQQSFPESQIRKRGEEQIDQARRFLGAWGARREVKNETIHTGADIASTGASTMGMSAYRAVHTKSLSEIALEAGRNPKSMWANLKTRLAQEKEAGKVRAAAKAVIATGAIEVKERSVQWVPSQILDWKTRAAEAIDKKIEWLRKNHKKVDELRITKEMEERYKRLAKEYGQPRPVTQTRKFWSPNKGKLADLEAQSREGLKSAQEMAKSPNPWNRRVGNMWAKEAQKRLDEIAYAREHWNDPVMRETVATIRKQLREAWQWEHDHGLKVQQFMNYVPDRFEGEIWNDDSILFSNWEVLGRNFRKARRFDNAYQAIQHGPYILKSSDAADLVGHRVRQGAAAVNKGLWYQKITETKDPATNEPIAYWTKQTGKGDPQIILPDGSTAEKPMEYEAVSFDGDRTHLAVRKGFVNAVKAAAGESAVRNTPVVRDALRFGQFLKHNGILIYDTFHPARLSQYGLALTGFPSWQRGWSVLEFPKEMLSEQFPGDKSEVVRKGILEPNIVKWATEPVEVNLGGGKKLTTTRWDIAQQAVKQSGINVGRLQDTLYNQTSHLLPGLKFLNRFIFDKMTRGLMMQAFVENFEKYNARHPEIPFQRLMRDVAKDINFRFGAIGRQGLIKQPWLRDMSQLFFLAPQWVEGLAQSEIRTLGRLTGISRMTGRAGLPALGTLGSSMMKGLAAYFAFTQVLNLLNRGKFTFQNPEKDHLLDAYIHIPGTDEKGDFWISPMSVFAELSHDIIRYWETKPKLWDAIDQVGRNKLGPWGRLGMVLARQKNERGEQITSTAGIVKEAGGQLAPYPITFQRPGQYLLSKVGLAAPPQPGVTTRQLMASLGGIKTQAVDAPTRQISRMAERFLSDNNLKAEPVELTPTDQATYGKLRSAIRAGDGRGAERVYQGLLRTHTPEQIFHGMQLAARRPFTGSHAHEQQFISNLSDEQRDLYTAAERERIEGMQAFVNWFVNRP